MKKFKVFMAIAMVLTVSSVQTSCIGSFRLTNNIYDWNTQLGDKFLNEVVFLVLNIVPVYSFSLLIDGIVLNSIEFWTGENPLAMQEGEKETKIVEQNGIKYQVTASLNRFDFVQLKGSAKGTSGALVYNPATQTWNYEGNNQSIKLVELTNQGTANVFFPNGASVNVEASQNGLAALKSMINSETLVAQR